MPVGLIVEQQPDVVEANQPAPTEPDPTESAVDEVLDDELLVEEVSIDGMCGVY